MHIHVSDQDPGLESRLTHHVVVDDLLETLSTLFQALLQR